MIFKRKSVVTFSTELTQMATEQKKACTHGSTPLLPTPDHPPQTYNLMDVHKFIKLVPDWPKPGIQFRYYSPLLKEPLMFEGAVFELTMLCENCPFDIIASLETRGIPMGTMLQSLVLKPHVIIRKKGKLPGKTYSEPYGLEYGRDELEVEIDAFQPGDRVLLIDDVLATGGTMNAAANLVRKCGAIPVAYTFLIELDGLNGRENIESRHLSLNEPLPTIASLLKYDASSTSILPKSINNAVNLVRPEPEVPLPIQSASSSPVLPLPKAIKTNKDDIKEFRPQHLIPCNQPVLMWAPEMESLAQEILTCSNFRPSYIRFGRFPDNQYDFQFEPSETLANKDVTFIMSVSCLETVLSQLVILMVLARQGIRSLTIFLPYFAPGTHDRVTESGVVATAEVVARFITECQLPCKIGLPTLRIFDIHALQERFYPKDKVMTRLMTAIPLLKQQLRRLENGCVYDDDHDDHDDDNHDNDDDHDNTKVRDDRGTTAKPKKRIRFTIAFPDDGAYKRYKLKFLEYPILVCAKIRDGESRKITVTQTDNMPDPKLDPEEYALCHEHVVIVDDLVQSGNTLLECAKVLQSAEFGFKKISAYVTHVVFPNSSHLKIMESKLFTHFWCTNTNPAVSEKLQRIGSPFKVLSIARLFCQEYMKYDLQDSFEDGVQVHAKDEQLVYVASTNLDKLKSVFNQCFRHHPWHSRIFSVDKCSSGVPEQPFGVETIHGAFNRLMNMIEKVPNDAPCGVFRFFIAIENGIFSNNPAELLHDASTESKTERNKAQVWDAPVVAAALIPPCNAANNEQPVFNGTIDMYEDNVLDHAGVTQMRTSRVYEEWQQRSQAQLKEQKKRAKAIAIPFKVAIFYSRKKGKVDITECKEYLDECLGAANHSVTFGSIIEKRRGYRKNSWHQHLAKNQEDRTALIEEVLDDLFDIFSSA